MMSTLLLLRLFAELLLCFRISFARLALLFFLQLFFIFYVSHSQLGNYICTTLLYSLCFYCAGTIVYFVVFLSLT